MLDPIVQVSMCLPTSVLLLLTHACHIPSYRSSRSAICSTQSCILLVSLPLVITSVPTCWLTAYPQVRYVGNIHIRSLWDYQMVTPPR